MVNRLFGGYLKLVNARIVDSKVKTMKTFVCDRCNKVLKTHAEPYGSWYKNVRYTVTIEDNIAQGFPPKIYDVCDSCIHEIRRFFVVCDKR